LCFIEVIISRVIQGLSFNLRCFRNSFIIGAFYYRSILVLMISIKSVKIWLKLLRFMSALYWKKF